MVDAGPGEELGRARVRGGAADVVLEALGTAGAAGLRPAETNSRRKVGGLRREEVAALAAISVDYYTRLEQGRVRASATVLATLARALRLDEDQQRYLYELAGKADARPRQRRPAQRVRPAMRRLLDQLTATPAVVLGKRLDILEWNSAAAALYTDFSLIPDGRRNYVWLLFTDWSSGGCTGNGSTTPATPSPRCGWRPRQTPTTQGSPGSSASCRSRTPSSAPGGPNIASPAPATAPSSTVIGWSAIYP